MQLCLFMPDGTHVCTEVVDPKTTLIVDLLKLWDTVEGGVLWLKGAWHDRAMILVKGRRGWRSMLNTDTRWRALHKRKLDGWP